MIRAGVTLGALLAGAVPLGAAEGGPIRTGEHARFSRLVMTIDPKTEWSLETAEGRATILFPDRALSFGIERVFDLIPRDRVREVRTEIRAEGTVVEVDLGCDCRVSASFVGARYLALDIADRDAPRPEVVPGLPKPAMPTPNSPPAQETAEDRRQRETAAVASAEQVLIQQIERAASQGLIQLADEEAAAGAEPPDLSRAQEPEPVPEVAPDIAMPAAPAGMPPPALPAQDATGGQRTTEPLAGLIDHDQIAAMTVFDRDGASVASRMADPATPPECRPDTAFDIARWTNGGSLRTQMPQLSRLIVGEFDEPDPNAVRNLARLYVRFGFGMEAESLVTGLPVEFPDRDLLIEIARAVEGRPVDAAGPLALIAACPGRHGLWLALGGAAPVFHNEAHFAGIQAAFAELPPDLRALTGPGLMGRLLDAERPDEARLIHETALRPGVPPSVELRLAQARLVAAEGHPVEAVQALNDLVESGTSNAVEALGHMTRLALDADLPIPERVVTDLQGAALQHRDTAREADLRGLLIEALAGRDELAAAVAEIIAAKADLPAEAGRFDALAVQVLAAAAPERVGPSTYADIMLSHADLIGPDPANDFARRAIAAHLISLGLSNGALSLLAPVTGRGDTPGRILAARAHLALGEAPAALAALGDLASSEAVDLRAEAQASEGAFGAAVATLTARGMQQDADRYVWPSGDWARVPGSTDSTERIAMAGFMAARAGLAAPPDPASDPALLAPDAAFQQPLPSLDAPSLKAARVLLATGKQVGGFVKGVLDEN